MYHVLYHVLITVIRKHHILLFFVCMKGHEKQCGFVCVIIFTVNLQGFYSAFLNILEAVM